jgi:hypothetical protein
MGFVFQLLGILLNTEIYLYKKIWGFDFKKSGLDFWHLGI